METIEHRHPRYEVLAFSSSTRLDADKWSGMLPLPTQVLQRKRDLYMGDAEGVVARLFSHKWFLGTRARLTDYGLKPLRNRQAAANYSKVRHLADLVEVTDEDEYHEDDL